jgi:hypothetical protein
LEIGIRTSRLNRTNQTLDEGPGGLDVRQSTWWIQSTKLGRVWVGQTDQATERITEINLSSTNLFLKHYGRWNGSFFLRNGGTLTGLTWGNILPQSGFTGEGVPGEGDRYNVVKYDSPEFFGFVASAAWGEDDFWDVALRYAGEHDGFKFAGGIGYADWVGTAAIPPAAPIVGTNDRGCAIVPATGHSDCETLGLSASILHEKTGLFVTGSYGIKWDHERSASFAGAPVDEDDSFYQVLAGVEKKFEGPLGKLGKSTLYGEYEHYDTGAIISGNGDAANYLPRAITGVGLANLGGGAAQLGSGADIDVLGGGVNQNFEAAALDLYLAYRWAQADVSVSDNGVQGGPGSGTFKFEPLHLIMSGARIQF